ncbi:alpha/beta hydrolase-fold protein [Roseisolibacter sp. H3M3-2]|uniref:alpha/beta hydrolase-fold protein n=1 Tax=Roseisolibacter sp. H3M3-2 TaxID=3031323 RepID=UPI0023DC207B|nr:alpha/beta hydrolase-fold protein [Roseisolibacter sp. H3M3-2]MDF1504934.1 alpha/beta hydrolase-fold protein [Roseisolibacter sp. H3M3-2]
MRLVRPLLALLVCVAGLAPAAAAQSFRLSFPAATHAGPVTGRAFLFVARRGEPEPRLQAGSRRGSEPFFGVDVEGLAPGRAVEIDAATPGFPLATLKQLPAGEYYVQGMILPYTQFRRSDGHTVWAHMDAGEGQRFNAAPGSLVSAVQRVRIDPAAPAVVSLALDRTIPPVAPIADTEWVKRFTITSKLASAFWNHPMPLGAVVLLPKGYAENPARRYPVVYTIGHYGRGAPFGFTFEGCDRPESAEARAARLARTAREPGCEFQRAWTSGQVPEVIAVFLQHTTPFYDDSYALNSANNGPYGDAITRELIPEVDRRFRTIGSASARVITGGSTGGWDALALQIHYPDVFGGAWSLYPDQLDFRNYQFGDVYADSNAFVRADGSWLPREVPSSRTPEGLTELTVREENQAEAVIASRGRSGGQWDGWQAAWAPVGADGYPKPLWDKRTGAIDRSVAESMRARGYDLREYLERNWGTVGPKLVGKLHVAVGDMDNYFLNLGVYRFEQFLESTKEPGKGPYYAGTVEYGRPLKPHGWQPWTNQELLRRMAEHMRRNATQP